MIFAAYGYNESYAGDAGLETFRTDLSAFVTGLKSKSFSGKGGPRIVLVSPIASENIKGVPAADLNNARLSKYVQAMKAVAAEQRVGFADLFAATQTCMADEATDLTIRYRLGSCTTLRWARCKSPLELA